MQEKQLSTFDRVCLNVVSIFIPVKPTGDKMADELAAKERKHGMWILTAVVATMCVVRFGYAIYKYKLAH